MHPREGYAAISDYALIGNRHTCALVARDGSIDWCCLPHLDSPSVFASILDVRRGGFWSVAPVGGSRASRAYVGSSAVLDTVFRGAGGVLRLRDFLPIRTGRADEQSVSAHAIVRSIACLEGEVEVEVRWMPRPNYALDDVEVVARGTTLVAESRHGPVWLAGLPEDVHPEVTCASARARIPMRAGEEVHLVSGWGEPPTRPTAPAARAYLRETLDWWEAWMGACCMAPSTTRWKEPVLRSGMVLKILTNERSGAMAAAPTTSLPEEIGGVRNWDYRFCWVRDSSMITQAFATLGQGSDGKAFLAFLETAAQQHNDPARVQVLYGLQGQTRVTEHNLGHLEGYRDSRPVRIGNDAVLQRQLDVYGELLEAAHDLLGLGATLPPEQWEWLCGIADYVCEVWRWRDRGIWEVRGPEKHFTYSKLMCWVALDRALRIAERLRSPVATTRWRRERDAIRAAILQHGFDARTNSFVQSFEDPIPDASNLLIPRVGFLPAKDPRVQGTIDATLRHLTEAGLVHRYRTSETPDGVSGGEGAFGICTFWLADALAFSGRVEEAEEIFGGMLARANDVGLFAEEIDPRTGEFLGNFPQAFTHVGLINSAHFLGLARSRGTPGGEGRPPEPAAGGSDTRERRSASGT